MITPIPSSTVSPDVPMCERAPPVLEVVEVPECPLVPPLVEPELVPPEAGCDGVLDVPPSPSSPVMPVTVSFSWPGSGTPGTPVTVGVGDSRSPTIGTLGNGSGLDVGRGSGVKDTEGSGTGSNPAWACAAG